MLPEIVVLPTASAVAEALADRTAAALRAVLDGEPRASLCLTGGSTPEPAYRRLAQADLDWDRVHVFWTDERCVPADHPDSNAGMAMRTLIEPAGLPESNVHRFRGELGGDDAAAEMERELELFFGDDGARFDVLHLGMGADGHVASLFPGSEAVRETDRRALSTVAPDGVAVSDRVTLTMPVLNAAQLALFAATGAGKRDAFSAVLHAGPGEGPPAARVAPIGDLIWLVDRDLGDGLAPDTVT